MSDTNTTPTTLDLLTQSMNDLAHEIGQLDPDDPLWAERIKELHTLREIIDIFKTDQNKIAHERMDSLAAELGRLKGNDARRADLVKKIILNCRNQMPEGAITASCL
jgi:hypothetical protein